MIKAIITDVDGVIVGTKTGINFPLPSDRIIDRLKAVSQSGIPIVLCTGKFSYAIEGIIKKAELNNPHITDGGALIYNPFQDQIIAEYVIDTALAHEIINTSLEQGYYLELHSTKDYFIQQDLEYALTAIRTAAMQKEPVRVASLLNAVATIEVIKILVFVKDASGKEALAKILTPFAEQTNAMWSTIPIMRPVLARVITTKGVSKKHAAEEVLNYLGLSFADCLGVGDMPADWGFIQHCKYAAITGEADEEFKQQVMTKGEGNYLLAPSADEDGFLQVLDYFLKQN